MVAILCTTVLFGQHSISFSIKNAETRSRWQEHQCLLFLLNKELQRIASGFVEFRNLAAGKYIFRFSYTELEEKEETIVIPYEGKQPHEIFLETR